MRRKKIALLSNVTTDLLVSRMRKEFDIYTPSGYDTWIPEVLNQNSSIYEEDIEVIVILLDGTELKTWVEYSAFMEKLNMWQEAIDVLLEKVMDVPVFISNIDVRSSSIVSMSESTISFEIENTWHKYVNGLIKVHKNVYWYDIKTSITEIGRRAFYSDKMWYLGNMPYAREGLTKISTDICRLINRYYNASKKVIVLDLDNTLWGGVIGEDGIDGIELSDHKEGQRFYDFQKQLLEMKHRGVLLAINSKNNVEDAKKVFDEHPYSVLKWVDFVSKKINWNNKALNIKEMESELNLTESSFVFIDDNPVEREIVRGECQEVTVLDFPEDTTELFEFAQKFYKQYFQQPKILAEDSLKTEMYLAEEKRREEKSSSLNLDEYIKKLEMEADIHLMSNCEIDRLVQLCNKTNQFNLTTKRYSEKDIIRMSQDERFKIFVVSAKDKYGEAGLVSVIILKIDDTGAEIDTFLMSCRVMGRKLENIIFGKMIEYCIHTGIRSIFASYVFTQKNTPVKDLYKTLGCELMDEDETKKTYICRIGDIKKTENNIYKNVSFSY